MRLGIDEAGRGCVIGPMMFGAVLIDDAGEATLREIGVKDSKLLTPSQREALAPRIRAIAAHSEVVSVPPGELDCRSLGEITVTTIVEIARRVRPRVLVLDAPVPSRRIAAWVESFRHREGLEGVEIIAENRADVNHPVCGAASILAKTVRDAAIAELQASDPRPIGSGYPGDPATIAWLTSHARSDAGFPPSVRRKWETVRRLVAGAAQPRLF
jgi:ribonuclease HII